MPCQFLLQSKARVGETGFMTNGSTTNS